MRHSGSAVPGGLVTVTAAARGEGDRIEVTDRSGDRVPVLKPACFELSVHPMKVCLESSTSAKPSWRRWISNRPANRTE
jgi:hypothetical protein